MKFVMKKRTCPTCRNGFEPLGRGRRPRFCSAACRQKAYRKRTKAPLRIPLKALKSDLYAIADRNARARAAVKILEEAGYDVHLERRTTPPPKRSRPRLKVVDDQSGEHPSPPARGN